MEKRMWAGVGILLLVLVLGAGSFFMGGEERAVPMQNNSIKDTVEPEQVKEVQSVKTDINETVVLSLAKKKEEPALSAQPEEKDDSKEAFMARVEAHQEAAARARGEEALKRYYEKKEKRAERVAKRQARKEAAKAYAEANRAWREEMKTARENGDESLVRELRNNRPKYRSPHEIPVVSEEENGE
ncbi:MAG: hypothetical protein P794_05945 [Epsilonproteobacteria bacterium (ex Lamellibrachia satsuma)]|nr:MAG: hypothetical protein P794_05945 [Epsilonproteobacteria bacterium (ex Lamellibrachia satsuma)]